MALRRIFITTADGRARIVTGKKITKEKEIKLIDTYVQQGLLNITMDEHNIRIELPAATARVLAENIIKTLKESGL